ncbi:MAG: PTS IIA-like nitrogen-regulatory protein PtsN [Caulobacteraceae bacterium]|nr:PTS IIA-like nitrogen regulatory protein PtsN [Caulobacter sp.]RYF93397.1 MAG: PTS IIA-like nitrogen-regulatory protein PtsN [Caulobacteraceae bacterium]
MNIGQLLEARAIVPRASGGSKRQVLSVIADVAARSWGLDQAAVLDALLEREAAGSTGVGHGVAVPHARLEGLDRMRAVFVRLETPIAYEAVDGAKVDLLFALLAPAADSTAEHLRSLARVSRMMRQADLRAQLRHARTAEAILALLEREAQPSAA